MGQMSGERAGLFVLLVLYVGITSSCAGCMDLIFFSDAVVWTTPFCFGPLV